MLCNSTSSEGLRQTCRHPVPLLGLCSALTLDCNGKEKHNKLQSRPTEEFPQPLPLSGQIIINHRFKNPAPSKGMPFSVQSSPPVLGDASIVCMHVCWSYLCVSIGGASQGKVKRETQLNRRQQWNLRPSIPVSQPWLTGTHWLASSLYCFQSIFPLLLLDIFAYWWEMALFETTVKSWITEEYGAGSAEIVP